MRALERGQRVGKRARCDAERLQSLERVRVGLVLEASRISGLQQQRRERNDESGDGNCVACQRAHQRGDARALQGCAPLANRIARVAPASGGSRLAPASGNATLNAVPAMWKW